MFSLREILNSLLYQQEIDFSVIKNLTPGFWFVIEFHLQHMGTERENFVGSICVEPKDFPVGEKCPVNRKINLGITEEFKLKVNSFFPHTRLYFYCGSSDVGLQVFYGG